MNFRFDRKSMKNKLNLIFSTGFISSTNVHFETKPRPKVVGAEVGVGMGGAMAGPAGAASGAMIGMVAGKAFSYWRSS